MTIPTLRTVLFVFGYPALLAAATYWGLGALFVMGLGLGDAFCYYGYQRMFFGSLTWALAHILPLPILAALWVHWVSGARWVRLAGWIPILGIFVAYAITLIANHISVHATRGYCARPRLRLKAPVPEIANDLYHLAWVLLAAMPVIALLVWLAVLLQPKRPIIAAPPRASGGR